jgi:site-specific recombinase XerC
VPELGAVIADFVRDVGTGARSPDDARELRRDLTYVAAELGTMHVEAIRPRHVHALVEEVSEAGLPPDRVRSIVESLRSLYAYAIGRGLVRTSPLVGLALPEGPSPTPTNAMLALGEQVVAWTVRAIVIAFVLVAVGLAVVLA